MKQDWKPGTMIYPLPAVLVSCGKEESEYNIITVAWTGTICTNPPMCYISVRPERYSHEIIKKNMEFVINLTTKDMAFATDWCGVRSGRNFHKFEEMKLTPGRCTVVSRKPENWSWRKPTHWYMYTADIMSLVRKSESLVGV